MFPYKPDEIGFCKRAFLHLGCANTGKRANLHPNHVSSTFCSHPTFRTAQMQKSSSTGPDFYFSSYGNACYTGYRMQGQIYYLPNKPAHLVFWSIQNAMGVWFSSCSLHPCLSQMMAVHKVVFFLAQLSLHLSLRHQSANTFKLILWL